MVDVPEFEGSEISHAERKDCDEVEAYKIANPYVDVEDYETEQIDVTDVLPEVDVLEPVSVVAEVLQEEADVISEQEPDYSINEPEIVEMPYEPVNKFNEDVDEAYEDLQDVSMSDMTKERYEALTDEEGTEGDRKGTR